MLRFVTRKAPPSLIVDWAERRVVCGGRAVALTPLLWRLVARLARNPGSLVTRADLNRSLWPYATAIDTERRLNTAIRALRSALGDETEVPRIVETVRGHGYRWLAEPPARSAGRARAAAALIAVALLAGSTSATAPERVDPAIAFAVTVRAQEAVEAWRAHPDAAHLAAASRAVANGRVRAGDSPALLVLDAALALEGRWDWQAAEHGLRRALDRDPGNADARLALAWLVVNRGDKGTALRLAASLPAAAILDSDRRASLGWLLLRAGRPDRALDACAGTIANALACRHTAFAALGRMAEARLVALRLMTQAGASPTDLATVASAAPTDGYRLFLGWRTRHWVAPDATAFQRAQLLAEAGRDREAIDSLARSVAAREPMAVKIASTASFDRLRASEKFRRLVRRVGLDA